MAITKVTTGGITDATIATADIADDAVTEAKIADASVDEARLKISNSPTNGYFLSAQSGNTGGLTWAAVASDLVDDTSPQLGGDLDTNSFEISLDDSHNVIFGDGDDFKIRFDGTNSIVEHIPASGYLGLQADDLYLQDNTNGHVYARCIRDAQVELYYDNSKKFETTSTGATVTSHLLASGTGGVTLRAGSTNAGGAALYLDGDSDGDCSGSTFAHITHDGNGDLNIMSRNPDGDAEIIFGTNDYNAFRIDSNRHVRPESNNARDLGSSTYRWRNIYTNDLNLSNKGSSNEVDGTWGDWTIQEGESNLFLKNNRSGKKYKFNLTEVA